MKCQYDGRFCSFEGCDTVEPVVGKPRGDKRSVMQAVASLVATGRHQARIAEDLGLAISAVSRAMRDMRLELAFSRQDQSWTDATQHSAVEVARTWEGDRELGSGG